MTARWVLKVAIRNASRIGDIRSMPGADAAIDSGTLWIRGDHLDEGLYRKLAPIADGAVFRVDENRFLIPVGSSVATCQLPAEFKWQPLTQVTSLALPTAALPSSRIARQKLQLIRSEIPRPAAVLLTKIDEFARWGVTTPEIRLHACRFAASATASNADLWPRKTGSVLREPVPTSQNRAAQKENCSDVEHSPDHVVVTGNPLPPIPGQLFWAEHQIAIPLGYDWSPAVDAQTLREVLAERSDTTGGNKSSLLLWMLTGEQSPLGTVYVIPMTAFVSATRANLRLLQRTR